MCARPAASTGCSLLHGEALAARDELVRDGYTVVRGVMPKKLLQELRDFTSEVCDRVAVGPELRYQGSSHLVYTSRSKRPPDIEDTFEMRSKVVERLNDEYTQNKVAQMIGLEGLRPRGRRVGDDIRLLVISKPPRSPPLYWHQDFREWNSPVAATPWPHQVFFSYYLVDTTRENGCLRVIPGSHQNWHPLHDLLPNAHEREIQNVTDLDSPIFGDAEGAVDVPMAAGDLVIGDARLLHAAWGNSTDERRTVVLAWYNCFNFPKPPSWWEGFVPPEIRNFDRSMNRLYSGTRVPNILWRPRPPDYMAKWGPAYPSIRRRRAGQRRLADESPRWTRHAGGPRAWWKCELDGDWFWEDAPDPWVKYMDPHEKRAYWWRDDQNCFWV